MGLQTALHFKPGGYRLLEVGLNARRVVQLGEVRRLLTSPPIHSSLPHLVGNMAVSGEGLCGFFRRCSGLLPWGRRGLHLSRTMFCGPVWRVGSELLLALGLRPSLSLPPCA